MVSFPKRHAIARARFFLEQAEKCKITERDEFECYLEAAIVFGRTAYHRLKTKHEKHSTWSAWNASMKNDSTFNFFRTQRNFILKEDSPKAGQITKFSPANRATELYYFDNPNTPAADTVRKHLEALAGIIASAEAKFAP